MAIFSSSARRGLAFIVASAMTVALSVVGTTAANADVPSVVNIRLASTAGFSDHQTGLNAWGGYIKFVTAGENLNLTYNVTDGSGVAVAGATVDLNADLPDAGIDPTKVAAQYTGTYSGVTDENGNVTFELTNTDSADNAEVRPADMSDWPNDRFVPVTYAMNFTPTVGAATENVDYVWAHTVKPASATSGEYDIRLSSANTGSMTNKNHWWAPEGSNSYVKFVEAGATLTLNYTVTNTSNGTPVASKLLCLRNSLSENHIATNYSGSLCQTTNASGEATFTLTNNATNEVAEPRPIAPNTMSYWDDRRVVAQAYSMNFEPTLGAATEHVDRVWAHTVKTPTMDVANIRLSAANKAEMTDKSYWSGVVTGTDTAQVKFVTAGDVLTLEYTVTDESGNAIVGEEVTLDAVRAWGVPPTTSYTNDWTGEFTETTDSDGKVTFTLTNNTDPAKAETRPTGKSNMNNWDDSWAVDEYGTEFYPTVGAESENIDKLFTHIVKPDLGVSLKSVTTTSAQIAVVAPSLTGSSAIASYTYTLKSASTATGTQSPVTGKSNITVNADAMPVTITGLTTNAYYSVVVTAKNADGDTVAANTSAGVVGPLAGTAPLKPGAPTAVVGLATAVAGDAGGQVRLTWTAPTANNRASLLDYKVEVKYGATTAAASTVQKTIYVRPDAQVNTGTSASPVWKTGVVVRGLTNGVPHFFVVTARNVAGDTAAAATAAQTPATAPSAVSGVTVARSTTGALQVSWTKFGTLATSPGVNGSVITGYIVTCTGGVLPKVVNAAATLSTTKVTGLVNGTTYTCSVKAKNAKALTGGPATAGTPIAPGVIPGTPVAVVPTAGNGTVSLKITAPTTNGGFAITKYIVTVKSGLTAATASTIDTVEVLPADINNAVISLANGGSYFFSVVAQNAIGNSLAKATTVAAKPATTPGTPTITAVTRTSTTAIKVTYAAPASNGGSAITGYEIKVYTAAGVYVKTVTGLTTAAGSATGTAVTSLASGTQYKVTIAAKNIKGTGTATELSSAV